MNRVVAEVTRLREMSPLFEAAVGGVGTDGNSSSKLVWT